MTGWYRPGRHNRQELVYFQNSQLLVDGELRFVVAKGPITGEVLARALNTPDALAILRAAEHAPRETA